MKFKKIAAHAIATFAIAVTTCSSYAMELWEPHLPGVTEGFPAGIVPPEGLYFDVENYVASLKIYNGAGNKTGVNVNANVVVPVFLWSPGVKILGGDYAVQVVQPFDYTDIGGAIPVNNGGHWGTFNTLISPIMLGWHLPNDFHIKGAFEVSLPTASSYPGNTLAGQIGSGNGYTTLIPNLGVSWLGDGWNVSANMYYSFPTNNSTTNYKSGQLLQGDYTVAKTIDKWTIGLGAFTANQMTNDSGAGAAACALSNGCKERRFGLGPMISYNFGGGVSVRLKWNEDVGRTVNATGGTHIQVGLFVPLGFNGK